MHPVQQFRANLAQDEATSTASDGLTDKAVSTIALHDIDSHVRNLCFVWEDGRRAFFNYAYLISVDLVLTDNLNEMLLYFSGQIVRLTGYQLRTLFDLLIDHMPKTITANNPRYYIDGQMWEAFVTEIQVKSD